MNRRQMIFGGIAAFAARFPLQGNGEAQRHAVPITRRCAYQYPGEPQGVACVTAIDEPFLIRVYNEQGFELVEAKSVITFADGTRLAKLSSGENRNFGSEQKIELVPSLLNDKRRGGSGFQRLEVFGSGVQKDRVEIATL